MNKSSFTSYGGSTIGLAGGNITKPTSTALELPKSPRLSSDRVEDGIATSPKGLSMSRSPSNSHNFKELEEMLLGSVAREMCIAKSVEKPKVIHGPTLKSFEELETLQLIQSQIPSANQETNESSELVDDLVKKLNNNNLNKKFLRSKFRRSRTRPRMRSSFGEHSEISDSDTESVSSVSSMQSTSSKFPLRGSISQAMIMSAVEAFEKPPEVCDEYRKEFLTKKVVVNCGELVNRMDTILKGRQENLTILQEFGTMVSYESGTVSVDLITSAKDAPSDSHGRNHTSRSSSSNHHTHHHRHHHHRHHRQQPYNQQQIHDNLSREGIAGGTGYTSPYSHTPSTSMTHTSTLSDGFDP